MATVIRLTEALTEFSVEPNPSSVRAKLESEATLGSRLVAEGIIQITLPMPFMLRSVHVYIVEASDGWLMIDSGFPTQEAQHLLERELKAIGGVDRIETVVITHFHPDHAGLAGELQARAGSRVVIHRLDGQRLVHVTKGQPDDGGEDPDMLGLMSTKAGFSFESMRSEMRWSGRPIEHPDLVEGGEVLTVGGRELELVWTPGHTEGHLCVYDRSASLLFTGDHLLERITPHVGLFSSSLRNPLHEFEDSLELVRQLNPAVGLPAHEALVLDPASRAVELLEHHRSRRQQVLNFIASGIRTTPQLAAHLFRGREGGIHQFMAYSETAVHLEALVSEGTLSKGSDGDETVYLLR